MNVHDEPLLQHFATYVFVFSINISKTTGTVNVIAKPKAKLYHLTLTLRERLIFV